jgi:hypothetical protein
MKNSEKGKFEDAWRQAFDGAEQAPTDKAWGGIDHLLNKAETVSMKHRVVFYQRLAAASVLFAFLLGSISVYYVYNLANYQVSTLSQSHPSELLGREQLNSNTPTDHSEPISDVAIEKNLTGTSSREMSSESNITSNSTSIVSTNESDNKMEVQPHDFIDEQIVQQINVSKTTSNHPSLISMLPEPSVELQGELKVVTIVRKLPAMPSSFMSSKKEAQSSENLWASLGASTGNYSPSADLSPGTVSKALYQSPSGVSNTQNAFSTSSSKGTVFSLGMNVGKRLSKRWLLQGGVSYLNQAIGYTSNYAVVDASNNVRASVADFSTNASALVVPLSSPYEINSVNEFISLPIQAGYLLVDEKFGFQLNSGISTDFFMQNTLTDKSGQLASSSSGSGSTSPFRTVSWAGLMGTEISYRVSNQYRLAIAPGLRYSLNSVLKSGATPSNPLVWDIGFRFRYIFN